MKNASYIALAWFFTIGLMLWVVPAPGRAQKAEEVMKPHYGDQMIASYFRQQVAHIAGHYLDGSKTLNDWTERRETLRRQLFEMLGLWPLPQKTEMQVATTGRIEQGDLVVEKIHYQSLPGLYVTANLYRPREIKERLPAILYVCGHGNVKKGGISYGSKTSYQHHPAWFARHGYVAMVIDTLQLGEVEGLHHGTYRAGLWWWIARGYTPAGVETWNAMRALDYLQTRPEVDANRLGVTGRSGGGAYSWYLAALDDRVKVAVPVAGITDLQNHVVDGAIEGHCDCMYMINTYRWDFPLLAALVAPRPLLLANSDKDNIFPLDGVLRIHEKLRGIYRLYGAEDRLGLLITEGPHRDTQDLQVPAFRWMNRWLKQADPLIEVSATKLFEPEALKVFDKRPDPEWNTRIHERFVAAATAPDPPRDRAAWESLRQQWLETLRRRSFSGWPESPADPAIQKVQEIAGQGLRLTAYTFSAQPEVPLRLWVLRDLQDQKPRQALVQVLDQPEWTAWLSALAGGFAERLPDIVGPGWEAAPLPSPSAERWEALRRKIRQEKNALVFVAPRGIGPTAWSGKKDAHIRRRFVLIGQTLDGMRVWDVHQALAALRGLSNFKSTRWRLEGRHTMAGVALYAAIFAPDVAQVDLWTPPTTHREGPIFLNVQQVLDMPQALAMALSKSEITLYNSPPDPWQWSQTLAGNLKLRPSALQFRIAPE